MRWGALVAVRAPVTLGLAGMKGRVSITVAFKQGWWRIIAADLAQKE